MEGDGHTRLGEPCPERIEVGMGDRLAGDRCEENVDHSRAHAEHGVELAHGPREIDEGHRRHREDAMAVVEAPGLVEPAIERPQVGDTGRGVVPELPLQPEPETRPHDDRLDLLLVHPGEPRVPIVEARHLARLDHFFVGQRPVARVLVGDDGAGTPDAIDGRQLEIVGGGSADPRPAPAARVADDVAGAGAKGRVDVSRKGFVGLVVVIVDVDQSVGKSGAFGPHDRFLLVARLEGTRREHGRCFG